MKSNENNKRRIYDKVSKTWYEVTPEQYAEFDRFRTNKRKREQYHGRCMCPRQKWWLCDGMCDDCEFHAPGDTLSLNKPVSNSEGDEVTLADTLVDPSPSPEDIICDMDELKHLFKDLEELMPEAFQIGRLREDGKTDGEIAEIIKIKRTTFRSQIDRAAYILAKKYPDHFLLMISEKKESDPFPYSRKQTTAYRAYKESIENESSIFECSDLPWESDMKDFVETLTSSGLREFAVTDHSTALMSGLHALEANGCKVSGLCKVMEKATGKKRDTTKNGILIILPQGGCE